MQAFWSKSKWVLFLAGKESVDCTLKDRLRYAEKSKYFEQSKGTYGSPRIYDDLKEAGFLVSENTIAKYMQEMSLDARLKKKYRVLTTDSNHSDPIAPRLFKSEDEKSLPKKKKIFFYWLCQPTEV